MEGRRNDFGPRVIANGAASNINQVQAQGKNLRHTNHGATEHK